MLSRLLLLLLLIAGVTMGADVPQASKSKPQPQVWIGMTEAELSARLGPAVSRAVARNRVLLVYRNGVRFVFEDGGLTKSFGYKEPESVLPATNAKPAAKPAESLVVVEAPDEARTLAQRLTQPSEGRVERVAAMERAASALFTAAEFIHQIYDPEPFDKDGNFSSTPSMFAAAGLRLVLVILALSYALARYKRHLPILERIGLGASELGLRVVMDLGAIWIAGRNFPALVDEVIVALILILFVKVRPEVRDWWVAIRVVVIAKALVVVSSFLLFIILLNLAY